MVRQLFIISSLIYIYYNNGLIISLPLNTKIFRNLPNSIEERKVYLSFPYWLEHLSDLTTKENSACTPPLFKRVLQIQKLLVLSSL
jgi:hypothetical protein